MNIETLSSVHLMGPVFYASLPRQTTPSEGHGTDGGNVRQRLVSGLWEYAARREGALCKRRFLPTGVSIPIQVVHDQLGKPLLLLLGAHRGPAISFSEDRVARWAALCGDGSDIGIDVAEAYEFQGDYPFRRVFNAEETQHALELAQGDVGMASALLWSVKEAVVKALGCGFHCVEPRDIHVQPAVVEEEGYTFSVCLSAKALERLPIGVARCLWVRSLPRVRMWLSIALLNTQTTITNGDGCRHSSAPQK